MSWSPKREKLDVLINKAKLVEPCLNVPMIDRKIARGTQYDVLDNLIYDALEDEFALPISDPEGLEWIDWLEKLEKKQLKSVSNAFVQQDPKTEEEETVQTNEVNKGQQIQRQPEKCNTCNKEFKFPVNARRHKWKHRDKAQEKIIEADRDQFRGYWDKLDYERAHKIMSIKDAVLPDNLKKLEVIEAVSRYVEAFDKESAYHVYKSLVAFLLEPGVGDQCQPFQEMFKALISLSEGNFFRGTLDPEMQKIVFPDSISMAEIDEQGLLPSFVYLVEYCLMKAWADDRTYNAELLEKEEESTKNQMKSTSKAKKSSASKRRKAAKAKAQKESKQSEKHTEDHSSKDKKEHDSSNADTSKLNPKESKESDKSTTDKGSPKSHEGQDSSNADAAQTNPVTILQKEHDSSDAERESKESDKNMTGKRLQDSSNADAAQSNPVTILQKERDSSDAERESKESDRNMTGKGLQVSSNADAAQSNPVTILQKGHDSSDAARESKENDKSMTGKGLQDSSNADAAESNPVTSVGSSVQDNMFSSPTDKIEGMNSGMDDVSDDVQDKFGDQGEWKTLKGRRTLKHQPQYATDMRATRGSQGRGRYAGQQTPLVKKPASVNKNKGQAPSFIKPAWVNKSLGQTPKPPWAKKQTADSTTPIKGAAKDSLKTPAAKMKDLKTPSGRESLIPPSGTLEGHAVAGTPDGGAAKIAKTPSGSESVPVTNQADEETKIPKTPGSEREETKIPHKDLGSQNINVHHGFDRACLAYLLRCEAKNVSPACIRLPVIVSG